MIARFLFLAAPLFAQTATYTYKVVHAYPHDRTAFTQGLIYLDGVLYEGTGLEGRSTLRKVKLETGQVLQERKIDEKYFGEGITDWAGTLLQLTWKSGIGFVYDRATFQPKKTFSYGGQGWGLTHDTKRLILSDGTPVLRFLDPATLKETGRVVALDGSQPVANLNELEYVNGEVFANIWQTDRVARIDPHNGRVTGWIDFTGLLKPSEQAGADVMNGIAYDAQNDRLFVTGKLWPKLFEVKLVKNRVE